MRVNELTTQFLQKLGGSTNNASENGKNGKAKSLTLTDRHVERLWERMGKIYGHKWASSYGLCDDGTWLAGLHDVTPEQIGRGLEKCRISENAWPPTLPEFRAMCIAKPERIENAAMYRHFKALPKPKADPEKVRAQLEMMRRSMAGRML